MFEEFQQRGFFSTLFNHLLGAIPGFNVTAYRDAPSKTDFSAVRAAGDVTGLALGVPGFGDAVYGIAEELGRPGKDTQLASTTGPSTTVAGGRPTASSAPPPGYTGGDGGSGARFLVPPTASVASTPAGPPPAFPLGAPSQLFAGINPNQQQNVRGLRPRSSFAGGGFITALEPNAPRIAQTAIDQSLASPAPGVLTQGLPGGQFLNPSFKRGGMVPRRSYATGGSVGVAPPASAAPGGAQDMQQELQRMEQEHPEQVAQIKQAVMQVLQTGELDAKELNLGVQLATAASQNPQLYPQLRQFAIQQGLAEEADLPQEYDQGMVFAILLAARAVQSSVGGQGLPQATGQPPVPPGVPQANAQPPQESLRAGGPVPKSRNEDDSVAINAHEGEGVLHAGVLKAMGTEWLRKQNEKFELDGTPKQQA